MSLIGTPYEPRWSGAILFLEDVAENLYKIDRMLTQLRNMGVLTRLAGVLLGSFTNIPEDVPDRALESIFLEYFLPLRIPVIQNVPFGHRTPKSTLPFGAQIRIDGKGRSITLLQAVVR
jgi:muramoyltetrapeptide carboxypeptidase